MFNYYHRKFKHKLINKNNSLCKVLLKNKTNKIYPLGLIIDTRKNRERFIAQQYIPELPAGNV
jgi:hypothetical protein